jgi:SNF2 family DNA or RNA helicase
VLKVGSPDPQPWGQVSERPTADLSFAYEDTKVAAADPRNALAQVEERRLLRRDRAAEAAAARTLVEAGFQRAPFAHIREQPDPGRFDIAATKLPSAVRTLVTAGWHVEAEGRLYRQSGRFNLSVTSGVDWFDLHAEIDFEGVTVTLPELLRALKRGDKMIVLGDGSFGMMPEAWLKKYALLAETGVAEGERLRFRPAQVGLLDALLAAEPDVAVDRLFSRARDELRRFERVDIEKAPRSFRGKLRPYQELGLGWLSFLRRFGFGGCLADDMGLGKTVQVLAMLASRARTAGKPSLVVVPKSLVWNWQQEAARFVPRLRMLVHVGPTRSGNAPSFRRAVEGADVVLTTYGLLRKDVAFLREIEMDYLILDEAQAIKNADSESAKAARLLRGEHRLALSGTPIENHIGELWSLVEFMNPGMLGSARAFAGATKRPAPETLALLARVLRPFILRRTKEQVAPELPPKHEETILCEMEPEQRRLYDELRAHYRASLLGKIARDGLAKAKIQVLEALLRLRQAACHPALIDAKRAKDGSGKLDVLLARLDEVRREGHKALVFSQFTSFLDLVRARLDAARISYEYLDGKTRDREACVTRFQTDAACSLFLVSLKAGGVGLNLTAADYVFILDPWWNPAVEAQAVDRAHRIGQDKHVFVYRLLCRDSVEEKVAALQEEKRDLAASIINADGSLIQKLDRETLELLLA